MKPIRVNRRRFLGYSAVAGLALSQTPASEAAAGSPTRLGFIGLGNRGTALLRTALEITDAAVVAVCDPETRHRERAQGIAARGSGSAPQCSADPASVLESEDVDAVVVALPCDLHAVVYAQALAAGKHVYGEKPLGLTLAECDALIAAAAARPELAFHIGFQRRHHPRLQEALALLQRGELGELIEARCSWTSSNGPVNGQGHWLADRARSGDWMVEQAVHVWDLLHWMTGSHPTRAFGHGRSDLFASQQPLRNVTDAYSALLEWPGGFHASYIQSWVDPADDAFTGNTLRLIGTEGGLDLNTGVATFRERGRPRMVLSATGVSDTRLALEAFVRATRKGPSADAPTALIAAREATLTGLIVREAVDQRRLVERAEFDRLG